MVLQLKIKISLKELNTSMGDSSDWLVQNDWFMSQSSKLIHKLEFPSLNVSERYRYRTFFVVSFCPLIDNRRFIDIVRNCSSFSKDCFESVTRDMLKAKNEELWSEIFLMECNYLKIRQGSSRNLKTKPYIAYGIW